MAHTMQTLDIRTLHIHYINMDAATTRRASMEAGLKLLGLFPSPLVHREPGVKHPIHRMGGALAFLSVLSKKLLEDGPWRPFLLMEDDCWPMPTTATRLAQTKYAVQVPADADAVFLGISNCGIQADQNEFCWNVLRTPVAGTQASPFPVWRIYNMLSQHAMVVMTKRMALMMQLSFVEAAVRGHVWDNEPTRCYDTLNVYAIGNPLWYQDAKVGGQEEPTKVVWHGEATTTPTESGQYHKVLTVAKLVCKILSRTG